jgi:DNA repair protein RadC
MNKSIKFWAKDDRPREKLLKNGVRTLSDSELLAILLGSGNNEMSAVDLSKFILSEHKNDLNLLSKRSVKELCAYKGIGPAKAVSLIVGFELVKRMKASQNESVVIKDSADAFNVLIPYLQHLSHEEFWVVYLSQSNRVITIDNIGKGGIASTSVDIRIVLKKALLHGATSIILAHNHPSGSSQPSSEDIRLTKKVKNAAELLDIRLLDHIIIYDTSFTSFMDDGIEF